MNTHHQDLTILIDAPALPRRKGRSQGSQAAGLTATLDWALQQGIARTGAQQGRHIMVVLRDDDPEAQSIATTHASQPDIITLTPHRPGTDPDGTITAALQRPYTLAMHPGVTPCQSSDTLERALQHLDTHTGVASVTGRILRGDSGLEAHPMPASLHSGATLLRTETLHQAGGLSRLLAPGGAADLDLTCRLMRTGQQVHRYDDLLFDRDAWPTPATPTGKQHAAALRDALIVIDRYFPKPIRHHWRRDTIQRAASLYAKLGLRSDFALAVQTARQSAQWERRRGRSTLHADQLETLLGWKKTKHMVREWAARESPRNVVLAGWHINLYAAFRAAKHAGLTIIAIADNTPISRDAHYHNVPVMPIREAITDATQGVILTDTHPGSAHHTAHTVAQRFEGPTLALHTQSLMLDAVAIARSERPAAPRLAA